MPILPTPTSVNLLDFFGRSLSHPVGRSGTESLILQLIVVGALVLPMPARAQRLTGTIRDSLSRAPIPGAVIILSDGADRPISRAIADERGLYSIAAPPTVQRLHLRRIGFRPVDRILSSSPDVGRPLDLSMSRLRILLDTVRTTTTSCPGREDALAAAALLEQAQSALLAIVVARDANPATMIGLRYRKRMDGNSDRIVSMSVERDSVDGSANSFQATRAGHDFARDGFASGSGADRVFFGPDPDVILDNAFISQYCFRLVKPDKERSSQVGLGFAPAGRERGRVDVEGTLWIDTSARSLRDIQFRYLGLPRETDALDPGGSVSFQRMPNGVVLVDRWRLRLIGEETPPDDDLRYARATRLLFAQESGGELAHVMWPDGTAWSGQLGTLRVLATAHDGQPASATHIRLDGTQYEGWTDTSGMVEIRDLVPGVYSTIVIDSSLTAVGIVLPTALRFTAVRDSTVVRTLDVPTAEDYVRQLCVDEPQRKLGDRTYLIGRVLTPDGRPNPGIHLGLEIEVKTPLPKWTRLPQYFVTGSDGLFHFCPPVVARNSAIRLSPDNNVSRSRILRLDRAITIVQLTVPPKP